MNGVSVLVRDPTKLPYPFPHMRAQGENGHLPSVSQEEGPYGRPRLQNREEGTPVVEAPGCGIPLPRP